jgi:hypothetical protein
MRTNDVKSIKFENLREKIFGTYTGKKIKDNERIYPQLN